MNIGGQSRLSSLDLIRGIAILGILTVNIGGFAGPPISIMSPHLPHVGSVADEWNFAIKFVLFEGKMRGLFTILFGAGLVLFMDRAKASGKPALKLQIRRLCWLALFGLAHFYLLWWGDILFLYAIVGLIALALIPLTPRTLTIAALAFYMVWHFSGMVESYPQVAIEDRVLRGEATEAENHEYSLFHNLVVQNSEKEIRDLSGSFVTQMNSRLVEQFKVPLWVVFSSIGETLPMMMLGIALMRCGFFSGAWSNQRLTRLGIICTGMGLIITLALVAWVWQRGFPPREMHALSFYGAAIPHLLMTFGYAALLVRITPWLKDTTLGTWFTAAGKMAFTNYIGSTILMTGIFYGWGLGWIDRFGSAWQDIFVLLGWVVMILFSVQWLSHFRRGPLEWAWRSLVEKKILPNR